MILLPWHRARRDITDALARADEAERRAAEAERKNVAADAQHQAAQQLVEKARQSTASLRTQLERNGFTEMLQSAWGRRA